MGSQERRGEIEVVAGQSYQLELHGYVDPASLGASPFTFSSSFRIGAFPTVEPEAARKEAADLAANCDVAIVVVGTNPDWESEGFDRKTMKYALHFPSRPILLCVAVAYKLPWRTQAPGRQR